MVKVIGENETAQRARAYLAEGDVYHTEHSPLFTFTVYEKNIDAPIIDGVDCPLEARFVTLLTELSPSGRVVLQRKGGNQNDRALVLTVPKTPAESKAAALAILRTCLQLSGRKRRWLPRWLAITSMLLLCATSAAAGETGYMSPRVKAAIGTAFARSAGEQIQGGTVDQGLPGVSPWLVAFSAPQHIICDGGTCGGASAYLDNAVFTAGSSAVNPIGCAFDDAMADLTSGHAGVPRCTAKRSLYSNLRNNAGTEVGTQANPLWFTMRGVAKGSTTAGDVTSTNASANRQLLDMTLYTATATAYDARQIRNLTSGTDSVAVTGTVAFSNTTIRAQQASTSGGSASWTNATAIDSIVSTSNLDQMGGIIVNIDENGTGGFTGGQLNLEIVQNITGKPVPIPGLRFDSLTQDYTFSLSGFTGARSWHIAIPSGANLARVRLNPAITGPGTLSINMFAASTPLITRAITSDVAAEASLGSIDAKTSTDLIASGVLTIVGQTVTIGDLTNIGTVGAYIAGTAPTGTVVAEATTEGTHWTQIQCWDDTNGQQIGSFDPVGDLVRCPAAGFKKIQFRVTAISGGNITIAAYATAKAASYQNAAVEVTGHPSVFLEAGAGNHVVTTTSAPLINDIGLVVRNIPSGTQPVSAVSLPLPAGAATATKQDTGNVSLASIDAKLTNPLPVSATSLPLPTNAATEPTLASVKSNTDRLDILLSALRDAITAGGASAKTLNDLYTQLNAIAISVASLDTKMTAINGMQNVVSAPTRGLPLLPCNPVRQTNCQAKGF